ncbi:MAG: phosphoadenylyl-sulfate reductase [Anaerolineae bacterium]|nr:phosphoadenylyl-sulfate reductase [Anaerolineae bacterium]
MSQPTTLDIAANDLDALNAGFADAPPEAILRWTWETFGERAAASSSFQTQSVPLLHLIGQVCPGLPVIFLDTGFHFAETLAFRDDLIARFGLNVVVVRRQPGQTGALHLSGDPLYRTDPDLCCYINKVEPMQRALKAYDAWLSGVRHDQTENRAGKRIFERRADGLLQIHPVLAWTKRDMWTYINRHDLPAHPLLAQGYLSIGCAPCTRPVTDGQDERAGRWVGTDKTECGLHLDDDKQL